MSARNGKIIPFPGQEPCGALILRVDLVLMPRPIWRRLRIGDRASFWDLHAAIQDAMGWSRRHRHLFTVDHPATGERLRLGIPEQEGYYGRDAVYPSWQVRVCDIARRDLPPFLYTYHLGDEWQHEGQLEASEPMAPSGTVPACLGGEGVCPPEGCGGVEGLARLLERSTPGLVGDGFDPAAVRFCDPGQLWREVFEDDAGP